MATTAILLSALDATLTHSAPPLALLVIQAHLLDALFNRTIIDGVEDMQAVAFALSAQRQSRRSVETRLLLTTPPKDRP